MIQSASVAGANMAGMKHNVPPGTCTHSGCGGQHKEFECPMKFAALFPGKSMPGWDARGKKVDTLWQGDNVTEFVLQQWRKMQ
eukprot:3875444-Rhodomonas_salina.1